SIIISPIFENAVGYITIKESPPGITAFHGYWLKDFYRLDPHFISYDKTSKKDLFSQGEEQLRQLIKKAHSLGLKIILDINVNHSSPTEDGLKSIVTVEEYELQDGAIFQNGDFIAARSRYFENKFKMKNRENNWFHDYPSIVWDKTQRAALHLDGDEPSKIEMEKGMLHGLADFNHENPKVRKYLINALKKWTRFGVDGYRVDAIKHFPASFFMEMRSSLLAINPTLFFIGEWAEAGIHNKDAESFAKTSNTSLFDFEKMHQIRDLYLEKGHDYKKIKEIMSSNKSFITFFEDQDLARVLSVKDLDKKYYDEMIKLLFMLPGIPMIYYGTEQYLHNDSYKYNRSSFGQIGGDPWNRDYIDWAIKDYDHLRAYSLIKRLSSLKLGRTKLYKTQDNVIVFDRAYNKEKLLYLSAKDRTELNIKVDLPDGDYKDITDETLYKIKDAHISVTLEPLKALILIKA
ncbi:MAG: alpha-amylase family glycosyl hydrolase, partial [bacterium]